MANLQGSQPNLALDRLTEEDALDLDGAEDNNIASNFLIKEEKDQDDIFIMSARVAQSLGLAA